MPKNGRFILGTGLAMGLREGLAMEAIAATDLHATFGTWCRRVGTIAAARRRRGYFAHEPELHRIRAAVREELADAAMHGDTWIVPATREDSTAAHLVALANVREGRAVRLWLWGGLPPTGSYVFASALDGETAIPADDRCLGVVTLNEVAQCAERDQAVSA